MRKIGRNEPCPCGSGKKYKKCCIDKPQQTFMREDFLQYLNSFWSYEEVNEMSSIEIIQQLEKFGILFDKDVFLQDVEKFYSAEQISEKWFKIFRVIAKGRDEDFPLFAAWILWERLAPTHLLLMEQMDDLIDNGFKCLSDNNSKAACDIWLKVWEALKYRFKLEYKNLDYLDKQYEGSFYVSNFCQDLESELHNAGLEDKTYFEKRINYCREFIDYFPEEEELMIHNMRRAIAESYSSLGKYEEAELECKKLVEDYPNNPWGYVEWGDMYFLDRKKDYAKAKELYEKGLAIEGDETAISALQERLEDLKGEYKSIKSKI